MACEQLQGMSKPLTQRMDMALNEPQICYMCAEDAEYTYNRTPYCWNCFLDAVEAKETMMVKTKLSAYCAVCKKPISGKCSGEMMIMDDVGLICEECFENPDTYRDCSSVKKIGGTP